MIFDKEEDGTYDVAMIDPSDLETREFLAQRLKAEHQAISRFLGRPQSRILGIRI